MNKRKARKKEVKKDLDLMKPLQFDKLGSADDPCFGKLHNPTVTECQSCGDAEICAIVFAQRQHKVRGKIESEKSFKDLQNLTCTWKDVLKKSRVILRKPKNKDGIPLTKLKTLVVKKLGIHESEFDKLIRKAALKQPKLKIDTAGKTIKYHE